MPRSHVDQALNLPAPVADFEHCRLMFSRMRAVLIQSCNRNNDPLTQDSCNAAAIKAITFLQKCHNAANLEYPLRKA